MAGNSLWHVITRLLARFGTGASDPKRLRSKSRKFRDKAKRHADPKHRQHYLRRALEFAHLAKKSEQDGKRSTS